MAIGNTTPASPFVFGSRQAAQPTAADKPKAKFWLNIGYNVEVDTAEGTDSRFVSLPIGIPLDTQEHLSTNSRNDEFAAFQSARNDLLDQIMEYAQTLAPGQDAILDLQIQLRRVNEEREAVNPNSNPFARKGLALVKAA